jgi:hypothetical protein
MRKTSEQFNQYPDSRDGTDISGYTQARKIPNDVYTGDMYLTTNNNYRKAFVPADRENYNTTYDEFVYEQSTADNSFRTKPETLAKLNTKSSMQHQILKTSNQPPKAGFRVEQGGGQSKVIDMKVNNGRSNGYDVEKNLNDFDGAKNLNDHHRTQKQDPRISEKVGSNVIGNQSKKARDFDNQSSMKSPTRAATKNNSLHSNPSFNDARSVKSFQSSNYPAELDVADEEDLELIPCPEGCGRSFKEESLAKHVKVCKKVFQTKRKKFDSTAHRIVDDEQYKYVQQTKGNEKRTAKASSENRGGASGKKVSKWKQQSEQLRAGLRLAKGAPLTPQEELKMRENENAGLVLCDYCGRRFNEHAAERHIPFCQQKNKLDAIKTGGKSKISPAPASKMNATITKTTTKFGTMNNTRKGKY